MSILPPTTVRRTRTPTVVVLVGIAVATVAIIVLMAVGGMSPDAILLVPLGFLAGTGIWFLADLGDRALPTAGVAPSAAPPPTARVDHRLMTLRNGIAYGRPDDASTDRLRLALVDLVDDQLLAAHDIDRQRDPARAAAVMGPALTAFVDDPALARRLTKSRDLDHIVTLIERL